MSEQSQYLQMLGITPWTERNAPKKMAHELPLSSVQPANIMFIVDEPLTERDDQLLTDMIKTIRLERNQVNVTVTTDMSFLDEQISLVKPQLLITAGNIVTQYLLKTESPLESLRNQVHHVGVSKTPLIVTYHPADLLRHPVDKKKAFLDLQFIRRIAAIQ